MSNANQNVVEVLLIEDREEDADLCQIQLRQANLANSITWLKDGAEALEYIETMDRAPRLILLDLKLPKIDGLTLLEKLRKKDTTRRTPVVIMTSSREDIDVETAYGLGANSYVVKPVDFDQLNEVVTQIGTYWLRINQTP